MDDSEPATNKWFDAHVRFDMQLFSKTFHCPDVLSQQDAVVVEETLQNSPGIESIDVDHVLHTVTVTTADQGGVKGIEQMLRNAGYPAEERDEATIGLNLL